MKIKFLMVCVVLSCQAYAQNGFKYQARLNVIPITNLHYGGGGRLCVETVDRKYNFGAGLIAYMVQKNEWEKYYIDSLFRRTLHTQFIGARGIILNMMRSVPFKANNNKCVFGGEVFLGVNRQINMSTKQVYDTLYFGGKPHYPDWRNSDLKGREITRHGLKSSLAVSIFARLELYINKRFTFSPEFHLPFCINNRIGGKMRLDVFPGFNFCLGYKFGKQED